MKIIKRYATSSTNEEIKKFVQTNNFSEPVCLYSDKQLKGKGQKGSNWSSEPYKNLTCSFYFDHLNISVENQFNLSIFVALAISKTLKELGLKINYIKWPNDILSGNFQKICGILIENTLTGHLIKSSVIGVGLNINQLRFPELPQATSLALELGQYFEIDFVLKQLIKNIKNLNQQNLESVDFKLYYNHLYKYKETSYFKNSDEQIFKGVIQGVTKAGLLKIYNLSKKCIETYNLKEIKFLNQP